MNVKIDSKRIKYYVNDNRVTAVITNCRYDFEQFVNINSNVCLYPSRSFNTALPDSYFGVATCDPSDEFSLAVGKDLARAKAIKKYRSALSKKMQKLLSESNKQLLQCYVKLNADLYNSSKKLDKINNECGVE